MEWQDISTAPKDGTRILAYFPSYKGWCTARYNSYIRDNKEMLGYWVNDPDNSHEESFFSGYEGDMPTHWMQLPAPPKV
jgi:hypothetical protein